MPKARAAGRTHRLAAIKSRHADGTVCQHRLTSTGRPLEDECTGRHDFVASCSCGWSHTSKTKTEVQYVRDLHQGKQR